MESFSEEFQVLFEQLNEYMKAAPKDDCAYIHKKVVNMKDIMNTITEMHEDVLHTGNQLEKFLIERQQNNNNL